MDAVAAFLNEDLDRPIYMAAPPGYILSKCCISVKVNKALYDLKHSGRTWLEALDDFPTSIGFSRARHDWEVYTMKARRAYLVL
jgi:hypothetical protein